MSSRIPQLRDTDVRLSVKREPLGRQVADTLRALIRDGALTPGTRLVEAELAELLKVSRGPIREALRDLDREGFVVVSPRQGATVAEWSLNDLLDAYDVRRLLEMRAIELVMDRSYEACAASLEEVLNSWNTAVTNGDRSGCAELDVEFHRLIWQHTGNRALIAVLEQSLHPINSIFYANATRYDDLSEVQLIHSKIQAAIAAGDSDAALREVQAHMEHSLYKARQFARSEQKTSS